MNGSKFTLSIKISNEKLDSILLNLHKVSMSSAVGFEEDDCKNVLTYMSMSAVWDTCVTSIA